MISNEQRTTIKELLVVQGVTFKPLQDEMIDHISCDVEERMAQGLTFGEALQHTMNDIPENHLKHIQIDTMDTINKRFALSRWLSYAALVSLIFVILFKILHLQFSDELLLLSFALIAISLLSGSLSGINVNREKRGSLRVLAVVTGVILLLIGYAFRILHFPGSGAIVPLAVCILIVALVINTLFVYRNATGEGNLLTYLHEKYTPGIERFLLFLLLPLTLYKILCIMTHIPSVVGDVIMLVVILGGGLQFIALSWRNIESNAVYRNPYLLAGLIVSFLCLVLLFLGNLIPLEIRVVMVVLYSIITAGLAVKMQQTESKAALRMACLPPILFLGWAMIKLGVLPSSSNPYIFNFPLLVVLVAGLFLSKKNSVVRTYMIVSVASYVFEYVH